MSSPSSRMRPRVTVVGGVAEQGVGQRRLARAVGPISAWRRPGSTARDTPAQDLPAVDGDVEVVDLEGGGRVEGEASFGGGEAGGTVGSAIAAIVITLRL